jgi:asparagine synthase (glutamine-hydrolysing)
MCGIAAIFFPYSPSPSAGETIRKMTARMAHRGPDVGEHFTDDNVALGHRRLSIIDLSSLGNQPMWDVSGRFAIVYNGEVYNYRDIKADLPHYPFRSGSDTEVIIAGFAVWGIGIFKKLNGIFSLVIYDKKEQTIYAVRDRFGIKPLYYHVGVDAVYFASEQRSIISTVLDAKKVSPTALTDFLWNGAVTGRQRICEGIEQLDGGTYMRLSKGQLPQIQPYHLFFEGSKELELENSPVPVVKKKLLDLLLRAVERQMMSDVPLGAFLSGGIDSSAIVALMTEVATERPLTFTIGFDEKKYDESGYAAIVAKKFNTRHAVLTLSPEDFLAELPNALAAMDTPTLDGPNTYVVSKITRKAGVTVALSGLGGDELFAGYNPFMRYYQWRQKWYWKVPPALRELAGVPLAKWGTNSRVRRMGHLLAVPSFSIDHVYPTFRGIYDRQTIAGLLGYAPIENPMFTYLHQHAAAIGQFPVLSQYSIAEMSGYTRHMLLKDTDQMSMASSLEVRVPFFDNDLVDYVLRIPDAVKYPHTPKELLVSALGDRLPPEIVHRPKMGFTLPWDNWVRHELNDFCDQRIQNLCDRGLLQPDVLRQMWRQFKKGTHQVLWSHIWMFVVLEEWLEQNMDV